MSFSLLGDRMRMSFKYSFLKCFDKVYFIRLALPVIVTYLLQAIYSLLLCYTYLACMYRFLIILSLHIICTYATQAQQQPVGILQQSVQNIKSHRSIVFNVLRVDKNLFSNDTAVTQSQETILQNTAGQITAQNQLSLTEKGKPYYREIFTGGKTYGLDLKDSVYNVETQPKTIANSLTNYINQVTAVINNKQRKLTRLKDTLVAGNPCYGFFVSAYDTVENNQHNYTYRYFYLSKKTLLPVYTKEVAAATATKGGYEIGRINVFTERRFANYILNQAVKPSTFAFNLTGLDPETKVMLPEGTVAPAIAVRHLNGSGLPAGQFANKIVLLQFGSVTCTANALANPLMNRLASKYANSNAAIACIYSEETPAQAQKYIQANNIRFPVYLGSSRLKHKYQTTGTPNFYLINQQGIIVKSINGYTDHLEQELNAAIDGLLATSTK